MDFKAKIILYAWVPTNGLGNWKLEIDPVSVDAAANKAKAYVKFGLPAGWQRESIGPDLLHIVTIDKNTLDSILFINSDDEKIEVEIKLPK